MWFAQRSHSLWLWNWISLDTIVSVSHRNIQLAVREELQRWGKSAICKVKASWLSCDRSRRQRRGQRGVIALQTKLPVPSLRLSWPKIDIEKGWAAQPLTWKSLLRQSADPYVCCGLKLLMTHLKIILLGFQSGCFQYRKINYVWFSLLIGWISHTLSTWEEVCRYIYSEIQ